MKGSRGTRGGPTCGAMGWVTAVALVTACASPGGDDDSAGDDAAGDDTVSDDDSTDAGSVSLTGTVDGAPPFEDPSGAWALVPGTGGEPDRVVAALVEGADACDRLTGWLAAWLTAAGDLLAGAEVAAVQAEFDAAATSVGLASGGWMPELWFMPSDPGAPLGDYQVGEDQFLYWCHRDAVPDFAALIGGDEAGEHRTCWFGSDGSATLSSGGTTGEALVSVGAAGVIDSGGNPSGDVGWDLRVPECPAYGAAYAALLELG